ncbi:MAG: TRAP transporter large permease [Deltaproteobacteria bacterium]|nr:TRAP transporter large permease [Deltaproteobacteria bacterium]
MSSILIGVIGIIIILLLLAMGMPIGFAMMLVGVVGFAFLVNLTAAFQVIGVATYGVISNYEWLVLPLFFYLAAVMFVGGLGNSLFKMGYAILGRLYGGIAMATVLAIAVFSAISGSAIASAVTIGSISLPEMKKLDYDDSLATASVAAGSTIDILIPPSTILIVYGIITETSIVELFAAGFIPGFILAGMYMLYIFLRVRQNPNLGPQGPRTSMKEKLVSTAQCIDSLILIALVLGGMLVGWFAPTEAAGIGAFGAIVASIIRGKFGWKAFRDSLYDTVQNTGMIFATLVGAYVITPFIAVSRIPMELSSLVASTGLPPYAILTLILLLYMVLGCFIDTMSMILLTVPVFFPLITGLGFDPIWFGIIVVMVVEIGLVTPPMGLLVWVTAGIAKTVPMEKIFKGIWPFVAVDIVFVLMLIIWPKIVMLGPEILRSTYSF